MSILDLFLKPKEARSPVKDYERLVPRVAFLLDYAIEEQPIHTYPRFTRFELDDCYRVSFVPSDKPPPASETRKIAFVYLHESAERSTHYDTLTKIPAKSGISNDYLVKMCVDLIATGIACELKRRANKEDINL